MTIITFHEPSRAKVKKGDSYVDFYFLCFILPSFSGIWWGGNGMESKKIY